MANLKCFSSSAGVLLAAAFLLSGCGVEKAPVAPDEAVLTPAAEAPVYAAKGRANKVELKPELILEYSDDGRTVCARVGPAGGILPVKVKNMHGRNDDIQAQLSIPERALAEQVSIGMRVEGDAPENLVVHFSPGGLAFLTAAEMEIRLGVDLVDDIFEIGIVHEYADGTAEPGTILMAKEAGNTSKVFVEVPGFSRYSLGGDYFESGGSGGF